MCVCFLVVSGVGNKAVRDALEIGRFLFESIREVRAAETKRVTKRICATDEKERRLQKKKITEQKSLFFFFNSTL